MLIILLPPMVLVLLEFWVLLVDHYHYIHNYVYEAADFLQCFYHSAYVHNPHDIQVSYFFHILFSIQHFHHCLSAHKLNRVHLLLVLLIFLELYYLTYHLSQHQTH